MGVVILSMSLAGPPDRADRGDQAKSQHQQRRNDKDRRHRPDGLPRGPERCRDEHEPKPAATRRQAAPLAPFLIRMTEYDADRAEGSQ